MLRQMRSMLHNIRVIAVGSTTARNGSLDLAGSRRASSLNAAPLAMALSLRARAKKHVLSLSQLAVSNAQTRETWLFLTLMLSACLV